MTIRQFDAFGTKYFITDSSVQNMRGYASKIASRPLTPVIIRPYFTVLDWDKARPIMAEFVKRTATEDGMIFYGWDIDGDTLNCREAYLDGAAANKHLENVGSCIGDLLAEGVAKLDSIAITGPAAELEKVKPGTEKLGTCIVCILGRWVWCSPRNNHAPSGAVVLDLETTSTSHNTPRDTVYFPEPQAPSTLPFIAASSNTLDVDEGSWLSQMCLMQYNSIRMSSCYLYVR